ncbi:MAG: hypothetical protein ACFC03_02005 [Candidatus Malihini olakiniferum]
MLNNKFAPSKSMPLPSNSRNEPNKNNPDFSDAHGTPIGHREIDVVFLMHKPQPTTN